MREFWKGIFLGILFHVMVLPSLVFTEPQPTRTPWRRYLTIHRCWWFCFTGFLNWVSSPTNISTIRLTQWSLAAHVASYMFLPVAVYIIFKNIFWASIEFFLVFLYCRTAPLIPLVRICSLWIPIVQNSDMRANLYPETPISNRALPLLCREIGTTLVLCFFRCLGFTFF